MTYTDIADKIGVSVGHISRIMRGEATGSLTVMQKIAATQSMSLEKLLIGIDIVRRRNIRMRKAASREVKP